MAISKDKKHEMVAEYVESLSRSQGVFLTDYRGLTVANLTDLRQRLREVNGRLMVVKNSLFMRALDEAGISIKHEFAGPLAVGFCFGEVPPVAKVLLDFVKESQILQVSGAILGSQVLGEAGVKSLAELPPREVLLAQLLGAVQGPTSSLVSTLMAPMRELVQVLKARSEQGAGGGQPAEAAA